MKLKLPAALLLLLSTVLIGCMSDPDYRPAAEIAQDKSVCAASGIELINYVKRYSSLDDANGKLEIRFMGNTTTCQKGQVDKAEASCPIGLEDSEECMNLMVNKNECYITGLTDCG